MLTRTKYLYVLALAHLGIELRKKLDSIEREITELIEPDAEYPQWAGEIVFNEGDDPDVAVDSVLKKIGLEVEQ